MARINIEDQLFNDGRFQSLISLIGDVDKALGKCLRAFKLAQSYFIKGENIPISVFKTSNLEELIAVDLATIEEDNTVYVRGSKEQFSWLIQRKNAGKTSGNKRKKERNGNETGTKLNGDRTEGQPQSQSLYSISNKHITESEDSEQNSIKIEKEVMQLFNAESQKNLMPPIKTLTPKRINWIKKAHKLIKTDENWKKIFEIAGTKSFQKKDGTYFQADFDFIFEKERYVKYLEEIEGKITAIDRMSEKEVVAAIFGGYQID